MGPLLRSCAKVREAMGLSFEEVSGIGRGMAVVHVPQEEGEVLGILFPNKLLWERE